MESLRSIGKRLKGKFFHFLAHLLVAKSTLTRSKHNRALGTSANTVLHVNTFDRGGGAAKVARDLFYSQQRSGLNSFLLVGTKKGQGSKVIQAKYEISFREKILARLGLLEGYKELFAPSFLKDLHATIESKKVDILHLHNLHGSPGYFALLDLVALKHPVKIVWTLHDMQAFTGHCAHSFSCDKWSHQCGACPALEAYPSLAIDVTAELLALKATIYKNIDLQLVTPSDWLRQKVADSIMGHFPVQTIHNGVDVHVYQPQDPMESRKSLKLPEDSKIVLFTAELGTDNPYKGGRFVLELAKKYENENILFVCLGAKKESTEANIKYVGYVNDETAIATYYSAADLFLYPSLADNCPLVVLEAMACELPVLCFNTGGIPEMVTHGETGYVAEYENGEDLVRGFDLLLTDPSSKEMGKKSRERILANFTIEQMNESYLKIYNDRG